MPGSAPCPRTGHRSTPVRHTGVLLRVAAGGQRRRRRRPQGGPDQGGIYPQYRQVCHLATVRRAGQWREPLPVPGRRPGHRGGDHHRQTGGRATPAGSAHWQPGHQPGLPGAAGSRRGAGYLHPGNPRQPTTDADHCRPVTKQRQRQWPGPGRSHGGPGAQGQSPGPRGQPGGSPARAADHQLPIAQTGCHRRPGGAPVIRLARSSIRKTLILVLLLTSSIALTLATLGFAVNDWFALRASAHDRLRAQAGIVASNSVAALTFGDRIAAGNTLESLQSQGEIIAAVLFAADGRVFAQYQRENERVPLVLPERSQGELGEHLFVIHPLVLEGETIGNILVVSELGFWQQRQRYHLRTALALFLLSLLVVYVISTKLQRIVSLPIIKLAKVARRVTESQDYSLRAEKLSRDEIGRLVDDFNEMLHQIQLRDRQLQGSRELLEEKVQERTAELTELTRQL